MLALFRPRTLPKDLLFVATERYKIAVLGWDGNSGELAVVLLAWTARPYVVFHKHIGLIANPIQCLALPPPSFVWID